MPRRNARPAIAENRAATELRSDDAYSFKARFGALIAATGVAGVPRALCHYLGELGLSYADLGFITHVLSYRWTTAYPFPAQRKLADQAGLGRTGIQRRVYALQELGYLAVTERFDQRNGRRTSNGYDFSPLFEKLNELIIRDWETVWKHRDPLVSDDEEEGSDVPNRVDNPPDHPQNEAGRRSHKWAGDRSQKAAGGSPELRAGDAHKSGPEIDPPESRAGSKSREKTGQQPRKVKQNLRATTSAPALDQQASLDGTEVPEDAARLITSIVDEYSDRFQDSRHVTSNRSRAQRLWRQTNLSPDDFVRALTEAGARTASHATGIENAMPYFFGVLKGVLRERGFVVDDRPTQD